MAIVTPFPGRVEPATMTDRQLQALITSPRAHCVGTNIDPDAWFPLAAEPPKARSQASHALALCEGCPVRAECLELSLRNWDGAGRYGIWGGVLATERRALRRRWLAGTSASRLVRSAPGQAKSAG